MIIEELPLAAYHIIFLLVLFLTAISAQDYARHGLFWSGSLNGDAAITESGSWQDINGSYLILHLQEDATALLSYELTVESLRRSNLNSPLPREGNADTLQIRCTIDGVPYRASSSYASSYSTELRSFTQVSSSFVAALEGTNHTVRLQWKKGGDNVEQWRIQSGGVNSGFSLTAQADHDQVWSSTEVTDKYLYTPDSWQGLTDQLSIHLTTRSTVTIGYSFTVQPQLLSFIKDRNMEYVKSRVIVDGIGYVDSGDTRGTNGWNPSAQMMKGWLRLELEAGDHNVQVQWMKRGNVFKSWGSSPSYLDGFAGARNFYILLEKFPSITVINHDRLLLSTNSEISSSKSQWSNVGHGNENRSLASTTFDLVKESAVLFTYALPLTQFENPNFDSNVWQPLSQISARLVIDGIPYTYAGSTISASSRELGTLYGSLALILPTGSHTAVLQWRSDGGFKWTSLNDIDGGFMYSDRLLVFLSSENAQPVITAPAVVTGIEDEELVISDVSVSDVDAQLQSGMLVDMMLSVQYGTVSFPSTPLLASAFQFSFGLNSTEMSTTDTLAHINAILTSFHYMPPPHWSGTDQITVVVSDQKNVGYSSNGLPMEQRAVIDIVIQPIDDQFEVSVPEFIIASSDGTSTMIGPVTITDIDINDHIFRVQLTSSCGKFSMVESPTSIQFLLGDGVNDTAVDFEAAFNDVQGILNSINYTADSSCSYTVHQESIHLKVIDTENSDHTVTTYIPVQVERSPVQPIIQWLQYPRWTVTGLVHESTPDDSVSYVKYTQYPVNKYSEHVLSNDSDAARGVILRNFNSTSTTSELAVLETAAATYVLSVGFAAPKINLVSSGYVHLGKEKPIIVEINEELSATLKEATCVIGSDHYPAGIVEGNVNQIQCNVTLMNDESVNNEISIVWISFTLTLNDNITLQSNYLPLYLLDDLSVTSLRSSAMYPLGRSIIRAAVEPSAPVEACSFNGILTRAIVKDGAVTCRAPILDGNSIDMVEWRVQSNDSHFQSDAVMIELLPIPAPTAATLSFDSHEGTHYVAVKGNWSYAAIQAVESISCIVELIVDDSGSNETELIKLTSTYVSVSDVFCEVDAVSLAKITTNNSVVSLRLDSQPTVSVSLSLEDNQLDTETTSSQNTSEYEIASISVNAISPKHFLTVYGDTKRLTAISSLCRFDAISTMAIIVDDYTLVCAVPIELQGKNVNFSVGGIDLTSNLNTSLTIYQVPSVSSIDSAIGSVSGGTEITVRGEGFHSSAEISCYFGEVSVPALFYSSEKIYCTSPVASKAGEVKLRVSIDGVFALVKGSTELSFTYLERAVIENVHPKAVPAYSEVTINIVGTGFHEQKGLKCLFGKTAFAVATVLSDTQIQCNVPNNLKAGVMELTLLGDYYELSDSRYDFHVLDLIAAFDLTPMYALSSGGSVIRIRGANFVPAVSTSCLFDNIKTEAHVINSTDLECEVPPMNSLEKQTFIPTMKLAIGGYEFPLEDIVFKYVEPFQISSILPTVVSTTGKEPIKVLGTGFVAELNFFCNFGMTPISGVRISNNEIRCYTPVYEAGVLNLSVTARGILYESNAIEISLVESAVVSKILPSAIPLTGGVVVTASGSGFLRGGRQLDNVVCHFGESHSSVAVVQSDTELTCIAPSFLMPQQTTFYVSFNGEFDVSFGDNLPFTFFEPVELIDVRPSRGPNTGGQRVVVKGWMFDSSVAISCVFGDELTTARVINSSLIDCSSPAHESGTVNIGVSIGDYHVTSSLPYTYVDPLKVHHALPSIGLSMGGVSVVVIGSDFKFGEIFECYFGDAPRPVIAKFINSTALACTSPSHEVGVVELTLASRTQGVLSNTVSFTFAATPLVKEASPRVSSLTAGGTVTFLGKGFGSFGSALNCKFGDVLSVASLVSDSTVTCTIPPSDSAETVSLNLMYYDQQLPSEDTIFLRYVSAPLITSLSTDTLIDYETEVILIKGYGFPMIGNLSCLYGDYAGDGSIVNDTMILCKTPLNGVVGIFNMSLMIDDVVFAADITPVKFYERPQLFEITPNSGPSVGGTNITVIGDKFTLDSDFMCSFGGISVPAQIVSLPTTLLCNAPPHLPAVVNFTLVTSSTSISRTTAKSNYSLNFIYSKPLSSVWVTPTSGPSVGGVNITVVGADFLNYPKLFCMFGDVDAVEAIILSDSQAHCLLPTQNVSGTIPLSFSTIGGDVFPSAVSFIRILSKVRLLGRNPEFISSSGGQLMTLYGTFPSVSDRLLCNFNNDMNSYATLINETTVECMTPKGLSEGVISVSVLFGNFSSSFYEGGEVAVTVLTPPTISSFAPMTVSSLGGANISVFGSGFKSGIDYECIFGEILRTPASFLSREMIACPAPAHQESHVSLKVKANGILCDGLINSEVNVAAPMRIDHLYPTSGGVSGGTVVHLYGSGMSEYSSISSLKCVFGDSLRATVATVVNDTTINCISPALNHNDKVRITIIADGHGMISEGAVQFDYIHYPHITQVRPTVGATSGGDTVFISGFGFQSSNLRCIFGDNYYSEATVLSESMIQCISPAHVPGTVSVSIALEEFSVTSLVSKFTYMPPIVVEMVYPLIVGDTGGTNVTIRGSGFSSNSLYYCKWAEVYIPAFFVSDVTLSCISPSMPIGNISFSVIVSDAAPSLTSATFDFSVILSPLVTKARPSGGVLILGQSISLYGGNLMLADETVSDLECYLSDIQIPLVGVSGEEVQCLVQSNIINVTSSHQKLTLRSDQRTIYEAEYSAVIDGYLKFSSQVHPSVMMAGGDNYLELSIVGGKVYPELLHICNFVRNETDSVIVNATVVSYNELICEVPVSVRARSGVVDVIVSNEHSSATLTFEVFVITKPTISAVTPYTSSGSVALVKVVEPIPVTQGWYCDYATVSYPAVLRSSDELFCLMFSNATALSLNLVGRGIQSSLYPLDKYLVSQFISHNTTDRQVLNSPLCPEVVGVHSYRNYVLSGYINQPCVFPRNDSISDIEKLEIDNRIYFKSTTSEPPRKMNHLPQTHSSVTSSQSSYSLTTFSGLIHDTASGSCKIDGTSCFISDLDEINQLPALEEGQSASDADGNNSFVASHGFSHVVLQDVKPSVINSMNASWVTISGQGFSNDSMCVLEDGTILPSYLSSSKYLQCLLPELEETRKLSLQLRVTDSNDFVHSINSLTLVYDFLVQSISKVAELNMEDMSADEFSTETLKFDSSFDFCTSPLACDFSLPEFSPNITWTAFQDAYNYGTENISMVDDVGNHRRLIRQSIVEELHNLSTAALAEVSSTYSISLTDAESIDAIEIYLVTPTEFLSKPGSPRYINIYGNSALSGNAYCLNVMENTTSCYSVTSNNLVCDLPDTYLPPGELMASLLLDCTMEVDSFDLRIDLDHASTLSNSSTLDVSFIVEPVSILSVRPLSGSVTGGTKVTIFGMNLDSVEACSFRFDNVNVYATEIIMEHSSESSIACYSPTVSHTGAARLELIMSNHLGFRYDTGFSFDYFETPEVTLVSTSSITGKSNDVIHVFGQFFPVQKQSFCNVSFEKSGTSILTSAKTISSDILLCEIGFHSVFNEGIVSNISVSFNGQDFVYPTALSLQPTLPQLTAIFEPPEVINHPKSGFNSTVTGSFLSRSLSVNARVVHVICDNPSVVTLEAKNASLSTSYTCFVAGTRTGEAIFYQSSLVGCRIPRMPPGSYELTVMNELDSDTILARSIFLDCVPRPKIRSVSLSAQSKIDGKSRLLIRGINFDNSIYFRARIDGQIVTGGISSSNEAAFIFSALSPGRKNLTVTANEEVLIQFTACISSVALKNGVSLLSDGFASSAISAGCSGAEAGDEIITSAYRNVVREIRSITPRSGLTIGNTAVEIIADGITPSMHLQCIFGGSVAIDATIVSASRVVCLSPSMSPHNVTVTLNDTNSEDSWCCGFFVYYPIIKVLSSTPNIVDRAGGTIVVVRTQSSLSQEQRYYCHLYSQRLLAYRINGTSLSCVLPPVYVNTLQLQIGSFDEPWSNTIEILVSTSVSGKNSIVPSRGSSEGNTTVTLTINTSSMTPLLNQMKTPKCRFGGIESTEMMLIQNNVISCITPKATSSGPADVYIFDAAYENSPELFIGTYHYAPPADIVAVRPNFVSQGAPSEVLIFGANFFDSPSLSCLFHERLSVPARWLSDQIVQCRVDEALTVSGEQILVQVTNNGFDLSHTALTIDVVAENVIYDVGPLAGFESGGTRISIKFRNDHDGRIICRFGSTEAITAYQIDSTTYICKSPQYPAGQLELDIVDAANSVLHTTNFTYHHAPVRGNASVTIPFLLEGKTNEFLLEMQHLSPEIIGNLRSYSGQRLPGECMYQDESHLLCKDVIVEVNSSYIFIDLSVNGEDFIEQFAVVQVFEPSHVFNVDPLYLIEEGGQRISFIVDTFRSGLATSCIFSYDNDEMPRRVVIQSESQSNTVGVCISPPLPLDTTISFSIHQGERTIFGPEQAVMIPKPIVLRAEPTILLTGRRTAVHIDFQRAIFSFPVMECEIGGKRYGLVMLSNTRGRCVVQPLASNPSAELFLKYSNIASNGTYVTSMVIADAATDLVASTAYVFKPAISNVSIVSESCSLLEHTYCRTTGTTVTSTLISACELVCSVHPTQGQKMVLLDICVSSLCEDSLLSTVLEVVPAFSVAAAKPAAGPVQGGGTLQLFGAGFEHDATQLCVFTPVSLTQNQPTLYANLTVHASTRASCRLPESPPGLHSVNIQRRGYIVSSSFAFYEYLPLLSDITVHPSWVASIGGTEVVITTQEVLDDGPYQCRFAEKYLPALLLNESAFSCQSPLFDEDEISFALSKDGSDMSIAKMIPVVRPPAVFFIDPLFIPESTTINITILTESSQYLGHVYCLLDGEVINTIKEDGDVLICMVPAIRSAGTYNLSLALREVYYFSVPLNVRSPFDIISVSPLSSIATVSTPVNILVAQAVTGDDYTTCCFGDALHRSPATLTSSSEWQCYSPIINDFPNEIQEVTVPIGLARADGNCEYFGFDFSIYKPPELISVSPSNGSIAGGTTVTLEFLHPLPMHVMYCKIGLTTQLGQIFDERFVRCITGPQPQPDDSSEFAARRLQAIDGTNDELVVGGSSVGNNNILVSTNGLDAIDTGSSFEFLPNEPDTAEPTPDAVTPVVYFPTPTDVSGSAQQPVDLFGTGFRPGSTCVLLEDGSSVDLTTVFVSESQLQCIMPVHAPGDAALTVRNPDGTFADLTVDITFQPDAALSTDPAFPIYPAFGPKNAETIITVYGKNLNSASSVLYCRVGEEWSLAFEITSTSVSCLTPSNSYSGKVPVRIAYEDKTLIPGTVYFEYIEDPIIFDAQPLQASAGMDLLVTGVGFLRNPNFTCFLGDVAVETAVVSNAEALCRVPELVSGEYSVTFNTNGQHFVRSGVSIRYVEPVQLHYLQPLNGPALRGGTVLSIFGTGFVENIDMACMVDMAIVPAVIRSTTEVQCRIPPHKPGLVNVSLIQDGTLMHSPQQYLQFLYTPDVSVDKITPEFGYTSGDFPVFVFGSNFLNTTALGCRFADMPSRGIYLSNSSIVCLAPSNLGRPELANLDNLAVEVTVNGYDYSESGVVFEYDEPCDQGFFCPGMSRQLCPNGTFCPENSRNFTLCDPGTFQPREGQTSCVICPIGYLCPDHGMSRPVNCPPGLICDVLGLRSSAKLCPNGHYCLNGTKASSVAEFQDDSGVWITDFVTGVVTFNDSAFDWSYKKWPAPAVGQSRPLHPPERHCDGLICSGGTTGVLAEAPFPCPIGHFCRAGVATQIPMPKNFSTPQRCYDGFFCPRGSVSPEGSGPCPNGYFCPTQLDAIICPQGHYCPGVGNTAPVECYPGTYNPFEGKANCTVCPTGYICPGWGTLLPEPCPAGFVCMALGLSYPVVLCPQGYRCNEMTLTLDPAATTKNKPIICRAGEFCLGGVANTINIEWIPSQPYGRSQPQICSEGTYCEAGAYLSSGSGLCFQGHYCPPNTSFPIETPVGNFASGLGSVAPTLCYPGTYAPLTAQVDCLVCPSGHTCISYGTYVPTICETGTYRSQVDSVTCTQCPTGTYSYEVGAPDLSLCLPCPQGRICGIKQMTTLSQSTDCPNGYICGYGTDRSSQFAHLAPAGYHTSPETSPVDQYSNPCDAGFYCPRGTPTFDQFAGKCPVGSFCPQATPAAVNADTRCPLYTTSLSQTETLQGCRIAEINVCDKQRTLETMPMEDVTYYSEFTYQLLDDSNSTESFDSSLSSTTPTGEVQVVSKIYPVNVTSSSPRWVNDTIEAFRSCPLYGSGVGGDTITIVGRNFRNTRLNYCRFRACFSSNRGKHLRRCTNQIKAPTGEDLRRAGDVSEATFITRAEYISPTRMKCKVPPFEFDRNFNPSIGVNGYDCRYIDHFGVESDTAIEGFEQYGNLSYVRPCEDPAECLDLPEVGLEFFPSLTIRCTGEEVLAGECAHTPEMNYFMNPCMSAEVMVEVTNDGTHYSGGDDLEPFDIVSTVRWGDDGNSLENQFKNLTIPSTFANYTYVYPEYFYENPEIMLMERRHCNLARYSEEGFREREDGWFALNLIEAAHVQINFEHLPDNLIYDEHYRIALFVIPSRCKVELCNSARVRLSPEEFLPCRRPKELSYWFQQTHVPKNVKNNITIFALDDVLFKVEIHLLYGLYTAYAPLFTNTTTVRIARPERSRTFTGRRLGQRETRTLSKYVSFEERTVELQYFFVAVYYRDDTSSVSQALNMPPTYVSHERGRVLVMNNVSTLSQKGDIVPLVLDPYDNVNLGTEFWNMPATTSDESKELLDAYFETFHETTFDPVNRYTFDLQKLVLPYFPYFSNCDTFDSYIPIWLFLEGKECELPDDQDDDWPRYKKPALPDQDDIKIVGPFDFFEEPTADWCERSVVCHYEEQLDGQDNTPRWFEAESGTSLFQIIRTPISYYNYTGRKETGIAVNDAGGGKVVDILQAESGDNFIPVVIDREAAGDVSGCEVQCFGRKYELEIAYYQEDPYSKRIIFANLVGDEYDFNQTNTEYELSLSYFPLGFFDLVLNFAYPLSIFMVIFVILGFLMIFLAFVAWGICRVTTTLQNPPQLKIVSMLVLILPPPMAGVSIAVTFIWLLTSLGYLFVNGLFITDPNSPQLAELGTQMLDSYPLEYANLQAVILESDQERARTGRIGSVFMIVAFCCFSAASKMYFPKDETKRELEIAKKRTPLAEKVTLWKPVLWKKANFMFCSFVFGTLLVLVVELSYSDLFEEFFFTIVAMLIVFGEVFKIMLEWQLSDKILVAPLMAAWNFISQLVTFGSPDFLEFLLAFFLGFAIMMFQRVFQKVYLDMIFGAIQYLVDNTVILFKRIVPKYLYTGKKGSQSEQVDAKDYRKREVDGVPQQEANEEADSVEPILEYYGDVCSDMMILFYFPFFVYLLMQYRNQIQIPIIYGIRQSDMMIYLVFQIFMLIAQPFADIFNHSQCELFHGWKIYEYLVYSRYRFLQRETRWKSMENSLDECIDESLRRMDQMCFSSQYYLMLTVQVNGIVYVVLAYETWLRSNYSPFSDSGFFILLAFLLAMYVLMRWFILFAAIRLKIWKIKHENTAWHLLQKEEDDLDIPAWEEIKGASTDAYLMNQRITSETFRYKFLNYNRTWLINQLPQLLTPRTMRRSRPYLINQFARIINARRDDISDDSDGDQDRKFGPVALTAPSRNIIRWWLGKARRRIKLRNVVEPLIKRARGAQCEQCLSRKQLHVEYEIDVDKMADMYDNTYPGDEEVDQVQWKQFWINNQRYHTICLACLTRRKEKESRDALKGAMDPTLFDDDQEDYPDWGPVYLSAASKAMLLNWYRKAQRLRAGKRGRKAPKVIKNISDDEGEDVPVEWLKDLPNITAATKAIATKWMRTARARLQRKHGRGAGMREVKAAEEAGAAGEAFRSGRKSRQLRK